MSTTAVWIGIIGTVIAVVSAVYAGYYWADKQIPDDAGIDSELDYLDELVREHEQGIADNRKRLKWLIQLIESNYDLSSGQFAHLGRIRRMLANTSQKQTENDPGKPEQPELPFPRAKMRSESEQ
jgi:hypothetical protein